MPYGTVALAREALDENSAGPWGPDVASTRMAEEGRAEDMHALVRVAPLLGVLLGAASAAGQSIDGAARRGTRAGPTAPASTSGVSRELLFDHGAWVTQTGGGFQGADVSEVEAGLAVYGDSHAHALGHRVADDFDVEPGYSWGIERLRWRAYQVGAPTSGTITAVFTEVWDGAPSQGGSWIAGDMVTNRLIASAWTGVYRVTSQGLQDPRRAVIEVTADQTYAGFLVGADRWIVVSCDGSLPTGVCAPPTVPWDADDNGEQYTGAWAPLTGGFGGAPADFPFLLEGIPWTLPHTYCTAKPTSCLSPGTLHAWWITTSQAASGPGSADLCVDLVPVGVPGLLFYTTKGPLSSPVALGSIGWLCITPGPGLFRVLPPALAQGTQPCAGTLVFDFGSYLATQTGDPRLMPAALLALGPARVDLQAWYRDRLVVGAANLSNAYWVTVEP